MAAALADESPSGTSKTCDAGSSVCSANPPPRATTRRPIKSVDTPSPTDTTVPAVSLPGVNGRGGFTWYSPLTWRTSGNARPTASVSTTSRPGPGAGGSTSPRTNRSIGSPSSWTCHARMETTVQGSSSAVLAA